MSKKRFDSLKSQGGMAPRRSTPRLRTRMTALFGAVIILLSSNYAVLPTAAEETAAVAGTEQAAAEQDTSTTETAAAASVESAAENTAEEAATSGESNENAGAESSTPSDAAASKEEKSSTESSETTAAGDTGKATEDAAEETSGAAKTEQSAGAASGETKEDAADSSSTGSSKDSEAVSEGATEAASEASTGGATEAATEALTEAAAEGKTEKAKEEKEEKEVSYLTSLSGSEGNIQVEMSFSTDAKVPEGAHLKIEKLGGSDRWKDSTYLDAALMQGWGVNTDAYDRSNYLVCCSHFLRITVLDQDDNTVDLGSEAEITVTFQGDKADLSASNSGSGEEKKVTSVVFDDSDENNTSGRDCTHDLGADFGNAGEDAVLKYKSSASDVIGVVVSARKNRETASYLTTPLAYQTDALSVELVPTKEAKIPEGSHLKVETLAGDAAWKDSTYLEAALQYGWDTASEDYDSADYDVSYRHFLKIAVLDKKDNPVDLQSDVSVTVKFLGEQMDLSAPKAETESDYIETEKKTTCVAYDSSDGVRSLNAELGNSGSDVVLKYKTSSRNAIGVVVSAEKMAITYQTTPLTYEGNGVTVSIEPTEDARIPEGTKVSVKEIRKDDDGYAAGEKSIVSAIAADVSDQANDLENYELNADPVVALSGLRMFDIELIGPDGEKVTPAAELKMSIKTADSYTEKNTLSDAFYALNLKDDNAAVLKSNISDNTVSVATKDIDRIALTNMHADAAATLTAEDGNNTISVTADADAKLPVGAELTAKEIPASDSAYSELMKKTQEKIYQAADEEHQIPYIRFYDLSIASDGDKIEPSAKVQVKMNLDDAAAKTENVKFGVIHFSDQAKLIDVETGAAKNSKGNTPRRALARRASGEKSTYTFDTESFSAFGVYYTYSVDFYFEDARYSLNGGSSMLLSKLLSELKIEEDTADIKSVDFSDPSLIEISKDGEDYKLTSKAPFDSSQKLTIKMMNGKVYVISVMDENGSSVTESKTDPVGNFQAQVFYGGKWKTADDGKTKQYVWEAKDSAVGHHFNYRVSFTLGDGTTDEKYLPGTIKITVPARLIKDRDDNYADTYEMSIPSKQEVEETLSNGDKLDNDVYFQYEEKTDSDKNPYIEITNVKTLESGFDGFIEMSYVTSKETFDYQDMTELDPFTATIQAVYPATVKDKDDPTKGAEWAKEHKETVDNVYIDTQAELQSMELRIPEQYDSWQKAWGKAPDTVSVNGENVKFETNKYSYFVYEVRSRIKDNTQKYDIINDDQLTVLKAKMGGDSDLVDQTPGTDTAFVAAYLFNGSAQAQTENRKNDESTSDLRYDHVIVAFDKQFMSNAVTLQFTNQVTTTVHPADEEDIDYSQDSSQTASRSFTWNKPTFNGGGGGFGDWIRADGFYRYQAGKDQWPRVYFTELGMEAGNYSRYDLTDLKDNKVNYLDGLDYAIFAEGYATDWTVDYTKKNGDGSIYRDKDGNTVILTKDELQRLISQSLTGNRDLYKNYYFKKNIRYVVEDDSFYLSAEQDEVNTSEKRRLTSAEDYQIDSVRFNVYTAEAAMGTNGRFYTASGTGNQYADGESITFYAKFGNTKNGYVQIGTYNLKAKNWEGVDTDKVTCEGDKITFKGNCVGYKAETYNKHYYTRIALVPEVRIKGSDNVLKVVNKDKSTESIALNNQIHTTIYDAKDKEGKDTTDKDQMYQHKVWGTSGPSDADYIRVVEKQSELTKKAVAYSNNARKKQYQVSWNVHLDENYTAGTTDKGYIEQQSGTLYDLLPLGASMDPNSIRINTEDGTLDSSSYEYSTTENFKDSGRTLVKIAILHPASYYNIYYNTIHSYEAIRDYGNETYNSVAYETGNTEIADGNKDNAEAAYTTLKNRDVNPKTIFDHYSDYDSSKPDEDTKLNKEMNLLSQILTDAEKGTVGNRFLFCGKDYEIPAITAAASGLSKKVKSMDDSAYKTDTTVRSLTDYQYQIRYANSYSNTAQHIVLFDSLENPEDKTSDWKGTLTSIDLSALKDDSGNWKVQPEIYYSTAKAPISEDDLPVTYDEDSGAFNSNGWSSLSLDKISDKDSIKNLGIRQLAVVLDKTPNGEQFTLDKGQAVTITLNMEAPEGADKKDGYPQSYNSTLIRYLRINDNSDSWVTSERGDTSAKLVVERDVRVLKKSTKDDAPIKGVTFRLMGTSAYGTTYDLTEKTNSQGKLNFKNVEKGTYTLMEYESVPDYQLNPTIYKVEIDDAGTLKITDTSKEISTETGKENPKTYLAAGSDEQVYLTVKDDPRVHADLTFIKARIQTANNDALIKIPDTTFLLQGTSDYGNDVTKTAISDKEGFVKFEDIEKGTYELTEIKANEKYLLSSEIYHVVVDESGSIAVNKKRNDQWTAVETSSGVPVIRNTPIYWDVDFLKVDAELTSRTLEGAEFQVTGSNLDQPLKVESNSAGRVTFQLKAGEYVLTETKAPTGLTGEGKIPEKGHESEGNLSYNLNTNEYLLKVNNDGTFSIKDSNGLELEKQTNADQSESYLFKDERALNGEITIYKKWKDTDPANRKDPVIHLQTTDSNATIKGVTVLVEWKNDVSALRPSDVSVVLQKKGEDGNWTTIEEKNVFTSSGNIWTYSFPDVEVSQGDHFRAYETGFTDSKHSVSDQSDMTGEYTGSATAENSAVTLASGRAAITNTLQLSRGYSCTKSVRQFTAPYTGYYKLEVWGASGGFDGVSTNRAIYDDYARRNWDRPGLGGYSDGLYHMNKGDTVYVIVGEQGHDWTLGGTTPSYNGGGHTIRFYTGQCGDSSGGGMTHISTQENVADAASNKDWDSTGTIIVAGGGGGIDNYGNQDEGARGGAGGGTTGGNAWASYRECQGTGGGTNGKYQKQGVGQNYTGGASDCGGGGGGWYGGASSWNNNGGAGGGSGYVSDMLKNAATVSGNQQVPKTDGSGTETGHFGDGYAKITFVGENQTGNAGNTGSTEISQETENGYVTSAGNGTWQKVEGTTDTYKYVLHVFDDKAKYKVWEENIDGYTSDHPQSDKDINVLDASQSKTVTVTNTASDSFGSLTIEKVMANRMPSSREFQFQITLADSSNNALTGTENYGGVLFTNGVATVSVTSGSSRTIEGIPNGYHYNVEEVLGSDEQKLYSPSWNSNSGTITGAVTAACTNTYTPPKKDRQDVTLVKKIAGSTAGADDDTYTIRAVLTGLDASGEFDIQETQGNQTTHQPFTADASGNASVTLDMKADETAVFKGLPVGATYQFVEDAGNWTASYQVTKSGETGAITSSSGENTQKNQTLATAVETVDKGENITVTFTNTLKYQQNLTVTKVVDPANTTDTFQIRVNFWDLGDLQNIYTKHSYQTTGSDGTTVTEAGPVVTADTDGTANVNLTMKNGESFEFDNLPVSARYEVREEANKYKATYQITDGSNPSTVIASGPDDAAAWKVLSTGLNDDQEGAQIITRNVNPVVTITNTADVIKMQFSAQDFGGKNLSGAKFKLKRKNSNGVYVDVEEFQVDTLADDGQTITNSGIITKELTPGDYLLTETTAPGDGKYLLNDSTVKFIVGKDKSVTLDTGTESKSVELTPESAEGSSKTTYTLVLKHKKLQKLPKTGGQGIGILLAMSALFAVGAAVLELTGKKRKS